MPVRRAHAEWKGGLQGGEGNVALDSGAFSGAYSYTSRFEEGTGTNPEELIAAAHSACFSMALAAELEAAGHAPDSVETSATVHFLKQDGGFAITRIDLSTDARVPGVDEAEFQRLAGEAKAGCPISRALAAVEITLDARLAG